MGKVMLVTGLIVGYGYVFEAFFAWYSSNTYEQYMVYNRMFGPYWPFYWALILCNIVMPQFLWKKSIRTSPAMLFFIAMFVNVGMAPVSSSSRQRASFPNTFMASSFQPATSGLA